MIKCSMFNSADDTIPKEVDLLEWLYWTIKPPKHYEDKVLKYRETLLRKDKVKIPCITPSATFHTERNLNNIEHQNYIICFDVDRFAKSKKSVQNPCINFDLAKEFFSKHPSCIYAGFSCSGDDSGLYVIMLIAENDKLLEYFEHFQSSLARNGINIDPSCKDYTRCRFFSVDKEAYFNPNAKPFRLTKKEPEPKKEVVAVGRKETGVRIIDDADKVWKVVLECERLGIDITSNYDDWIKIGAGFYNSFGEDGRNFFHRISAIYPGYNEKETDKKFDSCRKMNKVTLGSFFRIANDYGVRY